MSVDPVAYLPAAQDIVAGQPAEALGPAAAGNFAHWMAKELGSANEKLISADRMLQKLATGEVDNLHQVMISLEEAKLSFQLLVQVRNKLLEAYQDILRMQI